MIFGARGESNGCSINFLSLFGSQQLKIDGSFGRVDPVVPV